MLATMSAGWLGAIAPVVTVLAGAGWRFLRASARGEQDALAAAFRAGVERQLLPKVERLIDTVTETRSPAQETEAGLVPAESTHDALARSAAWADLNALVIATQKADVTRGRMRQEILAQRLLGGNLIVDAVLIVLLARAKLFGVHTGRAYDGAVLALFVEAAIVTGVLVIVVVASYWHADKAMQPTTFDLDAPS